MKYFRRKLEDLVTKLVMAMVVLMLVFEVSKAEQDREWSSGAVIVSDLSGLTKMMKEFDVQQPAAIIVRMRQLCLPILHAEGAYEGGIAFEADNIIAAFPTAWQAVNCSMKIRDLLLQWKRKCEAEGQPQNAAKLGGIGICWSNKSLSYTAGDFHGEAFSRGYYLGEECAEDGNLVMSNYVMDKLAEKYGNKIRCLFKQDNDARIDGKDVGVYHFGDKAETFYKAAGMHWKAPGFTHWDDFKYMPETIRPFTELHSNPTPQRKSQLERQIAGYKKQGSAMVFELKTKNEIECGKERTKFDSMLDKWKHDIAHKFKGRFCDPKLIMFYEPQTALMAAMYFKRQIETFNASDKRQLHLSGIGVETSTIIEVPECGLQFGDCINCASKMGEDIAAKSPDLEGTILISDKIRKAVSNDFIQALTALMGCECDFKKHVVEIAKMSQEITQIQLKFDPLALAGMAKGSKQEESSSSKQAKGDETDVVSERIVFAVLGLVAISIFGSLVVVFSWFMQKKSDKLEKDDDEDEEKQPLDRAITYDYVSPRSNRSSQV